MKQPNNHLMAILSGLSALTSVRAADDLSQIFANPPTAAHPHTWWHWNNGNMNKEGFTLDLEAMMHMGVTGAQISNVKQGGPDGPVHIGSPERLEPAMFAVQETESLRLADKGLAGGFRIGT